MIQRSMYYWKTILLGGSSAKSEAFWNELQQRQLLILHHIFSYFQSWWSTYSYFQLREIHGLMDD